MNRNLMTSFYFASFFSFGFYSAERFCHAAILSCKIKYRCQKCGFCGCLINLSCFAANKIFPKIFSGLRSADAFDKSIGFFFYPA